MLHCKKHVWYLRKYNNNINIYAHCKCGYNYRCTEAAPAPRFALIFLGLHRYCPQCGKRYRIDRYLADKEYFK